jgi:hypothetical protein
VTKQIAELKPDVAQLKVEIAAIKAFHIPQLETVVQTTAMVADKVEVLSLANTALGKTLTFPGASYGETRPPYALLHSATK